MSAPLTTRSFNHWELETPYFVLLCDKFLRSEKSLLCYLTEEGTGPYNHPIEVVVVTKSKIIKLSGGYNSEAGDIHVEAMYLNEIEKIERIDSSKVAIKSKSSQIDLLFEPSEIIHTFIHQLRELITKTNNTTNVQPV